MYCYKVLELFITPFEEERAYCFVHVCLGQQRKPNDFGVKGQGHRGQICQNRFRSITGERIDLPFSNLVQTSILGRRETLSILGSMVKVTGVKCAKTVSDQ